VVLRRFSVYIVALNNTFNILKNLDMKIIQFISLFALMSCLFNCSPRLSPFTEDLQQENGWTEADLKKIQFYVSKDIRLYRDFQSGQSKIEDGKVRMINGRKVEEIIISSGTPGVMVLNPKSNRIAISFEDSDKRFLMFGPNPKFGDKFVLLAKEWKKSGGTVSYDGRPYQTDSDSAFSALMIDLKKIKRTKVNSRVARGRKL